MPGKETTIDIHISITSELSNSAALDIANVLRNAVREQFKNMDLDYYGMNTLDYNINCECITGRTKF